MGKVTITIEDKVAGGVLCVEFKPSLREVYAKVASGYASPAFKYALHIGDFLSMGLGKPKEQVKKEAEQQGKKLTL
jgi:hypothetical protein